jgi:hypothetical protein
MDINGRWLKIILTDSSSKTDSAALSEFIDELKKKKLIKSSKMAGIEKVGGHYSFHYELALDEQAMKTLLSSKLTEATKDWSSEDAANAKLALETTLKNIHFKQIGVWISVNKFTLNRIRIESNAPSIASIAEVAVSDYAVTLSKSSDAKRLADVRQMASALELYYNDYNGYPEAQNGTPAEFSKYLINTPTAPPATGNCSDYYNSYWYQPEGATTTIAGGAKVYSSYKLTFCLGTDTGTLKAGIGTMTPNGTTTTSVCTDTVHPCFTNNEQPTPGSATFATMLDKIDFSANFNFDILLSDVKSPEITAPENPLDLTQSVNPQTAPGTQAP